MSWLGAPDPPTQLRHRGRRGESGSSSLGSTTLTRPRRLRRISPKSKSTKDAGDWVREGFRRFGEHCARNQIRTLLIDCLVMTNLFYPSFAAFLERRFDHATARSTRAPAPGAPTPKSPLALFTTPLSKSFFPSPPPLLPNVQWGPWWSSDATSDAPWVSVRTGLPSSVEPDIDLMRVAWADVGDVLDGEPEAAGWAPRDDQIVAAVHTLAESYGDRCVRRLVNRNGLAAPAGPCYLISSDQLPETLPINKLWDASQEATQHLYRTIAVPFHASSNHSAFESEWSRRLADTMAPLGVEVFTETYMRGADIQASTLVSYSPGEHEPAPSPISDAPPTLVFLLYAVLLGTLLAQLSNASKAHSRFGLAFTGVVQLCCSAVMSFSVLALVGWNGWGWSKGQTVLPTYALPFVIVVVGAENMSALTKAVFSVPFNHSVPERIGLGLSKVGTTIALTSLTDLALLGLCWLCVHLTPVREFCVFAAVVIVADWFMLHTFFLTVLSVDAQRLELADVLASNGGLSNHEAERREEESKQRRSNKSARFNWRVVLRARAAKSGSLLLLITSVALLYYYTERGRSTLSTAAQLYGYIPTSTSTSAYASPTLSTLASELPTLSPSEAFWRAINPRGLASVRINLPASSIAIFPRAGHSMLPADIRKLSIPMRKFKLPTLGPLWSVFKFFVVPQVLSALALYLLLRFLLKDSELLNARRNRLGRDRDSNRSDEESDDGNVPLRSAKASFAASFGVYMLPASHESDVDVLVSSADGKLAVSVGVDNSVCLWRFYADEQCAGTREIVPTELPGGDPIVGGAVSRDRQFAAVVTRSGIAQIWNTPEEGKTESLGTIDLCSDARVISVLFDDSATVVDDPFTSSPVSSGKTDQTVTPPSLVVAMSNGAVRAVKHGKRVVDFIPASRADDAATCRIDMFQSEKGLEVVICADVITRWSQRHGEWHSTTLDSTLDIEDRILCVSRATVPWCDRPTNLVVLGRKSGFVEVFDEDGEAAGMGQAGDAVRDVALATAPSTQCTTCDSRSSDGFFVISSTATHVYIDRVVPRGSQFCRCPMTRRASTLDESTKGISSPVVLAPSPARGRYRTNGQISAAASPMKATLAPPSNGDFPVSSHGGRRLSGWRDEVRPPSPLDRSSSFTALSSLVMSSAEDTPAPTPAASQWEDVDVIPLGGVRATDGGWVVLDAAVVGVRRNTAGIDDSQWHLWAVDLTSPWNGNSLLVDGVPLELLERRTRSSTPRTPIPTMSDTELPMRVRRAERILSMTGRASFPSSFGSFSVPTHQPLGYVAVRPFCAAGRAALAGFGNRVGVFTQPPRRAAATVTQPPIIAITTPRRAFPTPPPRRQGPSPAKI